MSDAAKEWLKDKSVKAAKTFVQGYGAAWITFGGTEFDTLFTVDNAKAGVVAAAIYLFMALGVTGFKKDEE